MLNIYLLRMVDVTLIQYKELISLIPTHLVDTTTDYD